MINALIVLWLVRKYPADYISNVLEAFVYISAILTFISIPVLVFFDFTIANVYTGMHTREKDILRPILLVSIIGSALGMACSAYITINSFRLLKHIKKNRIALAHQIKNIGVGESSK
jgi:hypothetical protein